MTDPNHEPGLPDMPSMPNLPRRLTDDLGGLYPTPGVPADLEQRILAHAHASLARRRWAWTYRAAGLAASILLAVGVALWLQSDQRPAQPVAGLTALATATQPQQTILHALSLARRIEATPADQRPADWDINRDGIVDSRDPREIARRVVSLEGRP